MKAKIYKCDTPNANGIVYPKEVLEKAVEEYNKQTSRLVVHEDYPGDQYTNIDLDKVVGEATLDMEDDYVVAHVTFLDTPFGNHVKASLTEETLLMPSSVGTLHPDRTVGEGCYVCKLVIPLPTPDLKVGQRKEMFTLEEDETSDQD